MGRKKSPFKRILSFFMLVASIYVFIQVYGVYREKNMNEFVRAEKNLYTSEFSRDFKVSLGNEGSYKRDTNSWCC